MINDVFNSNNTHKAIKELPTDMSERIPPVYDDRSRKYLYACVGCLNLHERDTEGQDFRALCIGCMQSFVRMRKLILNNAKDYKFKHSQKEEVAKNTLEEIDLEKHLITGNFNVTDVIDVIIKLNHLVGVGIISLSNDINDYYKAGHNYFTFPACEINVVELPAGVRE